MLTPNFGEFGEARALAELARDAEQSGWDGFFLWDHIQFPGLEPCADPWVALGAIAMAEDDVDSAIEHFEVAVRTQDELPYTEPPFWYYPTRHTLGRAQLAAGRPEEAEATYRKNLEHYPRNGWAMFGLMESLKAQGKDTTEVSERFAILWAEADVTLSSSTF